MLYIMNSSIVGFRAGTELMRLVAKSISASLAMKSTTGSSTWHSSPRVMESSVMIRSKMLRGNNSQGGRRGAAYYHRAEDGTFFEIKRVDEQYSSQQ